MPRWRWRRADRGRFRWEGGREVDFFSQMISVCRDSVERKDDESEKVCVRGVCKRGAGDKACHKQGSRDFKGC